MWGEHASTWRHTSCGLCLHGHSKGYCAPAGSFGWVYALSILPIVLKFGYHINVLIRVDFSMVNNKPCLFALQICPYNAIKFLPREQHITGDTSRQLRQLVGRDLIKSTMKLLIKIFTLNWKDYLAGLNLFREAGVYERWPSSIPQNELLSHLSGLNVNQQQAVLSYLVSGAKGPSASYCKSPQHMCKQGYDAMTSLDFICQVLKVKGLQPYQGALTVQLPFIKG